MTLVLVSAFPAVASARRELPPGHADASYLGVWALPEPYGAVEHVFSNETRAVDLERAGWTKEDA